MKTFRFIILTLLLVPLTCSNLFNDANIPFWGSGGCISYIPSSWAFVDGGDDSGINKDASKAANYPQLAVFKGRLYATWRELSSAVQIRVAVYNEDSTWSFVDGNDTDGINYNTGQHSDLPQLAVFKDRLYATWREMGVAVYQIRVAVYNENNTWSFVDGNGTDGINKNPINTAASPQLAVFNGRLYAAWHEDNGHLQIRVAVYNEDNTWSFVDGDGANGINKDPNKTARYPQLAVFNGRLYAAWHEGAATQQIRVAVYNENNTWSFVDGDGADGINYNTGQNAEHPQLAVFGGRLYAAWNENNPSAYQIRVAVFNEDNTWSFVDGDGTNGLNYSTSLIAELPQLTVHGCDLYITWQEDGKIRVKESRR